MVTKIRGITFQIRRWLAIEKVDSEMGSGLGSKLREFQVLKQEVEK